MKRKVFVARSSYERNYVLMNACDKGAFRSVVSICNVEAYDDATNTASESFLTWDILEDLMPYLTQPAIDVDIRWTKSDLERKVKELGLQKEQTVILINSSQLKVIPRDSAVLEYSYGISSLLDPTRVFMDAALSHVQEVGDAFLWGCSSLKEVDLSPLSNVQELGHSFLYGCSSLTRVILPASPPECLRLAPVRLQGALKAPVRLQNVAHRCCALS